MTRPTAPNQFPSREFDAPPAQLALAEALSAVGIACDVSIRERAEHARDWWPRLIANTSRGEVERWPGLVVRPTTTLGVSETLRVATQFHVPVTAQGGRSGVVGGAVPEEGAIALDLTGLDRIIDIDEVSNTVRVEAGVFGPDLEVALGPLGLTIGHFPQSFDLATVGGWIACRGAGQYSNRYGKIEDIVRALRVVLANGDILDVGGSAPRRAVGPDLLQLFVGSEGTLGIISEATLVVRQRPPHEVRRAYRFATFTEALDACRRVVQRGANPAVLRLYDETESRRNFDVEGCALIVLDEGERAFVEATMSVVDEECASADRLADELVAQWLERRNDVSALVPLWERGLVVDTIEVAGSWSTLAALTARVIAALRALEGMLVVSVHQSHAYVDGACLYFTFAGQPDGTADEFYRAAWDLAMDEVIDLGAAISHHHGIGRNRARHMARALGSSYGLLQHVKSMLDPEGLLNPGVLGLGGEPW
ncbi:MAG TPA: FAD-binding oxidoreductase [Acidimicrobiales bacterium]|nr:FAD-binding oxidoreductase [Acidimicrobiales bacterium]